MVSPWPATRRGEGPAAANRVSTPPRRLTAAPRAAAGARWRHRPGRGAGGAGGAEALPVPGFRLRVPEEDRRSIGGAAARRDFQTRTMASCWWRWRHGCSWRPAARSPRPVSPGGAGPCGRRPAAAARAQVRPGSPSRGRRGHRAMTGARRNEWERAARAPGWGPRGRRGWAQQPGGTRGAGAPRGTAAWRPGDPKESGDWEASGEEPGPGGNAGGGCQSQTVSWVTDTV